MERGLPIYHVGGSWRALAHLDMQLCRFPLPIIHQYRFPAERAAYLVRVTSQMGKARLRKITAISATRAATLGQAAALLAVQRGASIVRVHDVAATVDALALWRRVEYKNERDCR